MVSPVSNIRAVEISSKKLPMIFVFCKYCHLNVEGADEEERDDKVDEVGVKHEGLVVPVLKCKIYWIGKLG